MKVRIDETKCSGHGRCYVLAPEVYELDDDGYNADRGSTIEVAAGLEKKALIGVKNCPEAAIIPIEDRSEEPHHG
jgi:ferredoxin